MANRSRKDWDKHEPRMYESVSSVSDADLASFDVKKGDLVAVRAGTVSYGTIIFGKIRLPKAGSDAYIHVRIHDPPDGEQSAKDVVFHSLYTEEGGKTPDDDRPKWYRAIMSEKDPIAFFHE